MTSLLILLGVALSSLIVSAEVEPQPGFDVNQLKGKLYDIGVASDHKGFVEQKSKLRMGFSIYNPDENGDLSVSMQASGPGGKCESVITKYKKGSVPGVFTYSETDYSITMTFHEIKENEYAFVYNKLDNPNNLGMFTELIAWEQEVSDAVKEKWQKWTESLGISAENIIFLPNEGGCRS